LPEHPDELSPRRPHPLLDRLLLGVWLTYWVALFVVLHLPKPPGAGLVSRIGDKVAHFGIYLVLALLGGWVVLRRGRRLDLSWAARWAVVYAVYAAADELTQPLSNRTCDFRDWLADMTGVAAALALLWALGRSRSRE